MSDSRPLDRLLEIKADRGLDLVIPNLDSELPIYIRYAAELASNGIRVMVPTNAQFRLRSKDHLVAEAPAWSRNDISPRTLPGPRRVYSNTRPWS